MCPFRQRLVGRRVEHQAALHRCDFDLAVGVVRVLHKVAKVRGGLPTGFHFHDLRHIGNHLAGVSGASTWELMHRMGHSSMRAALIYQYATSERDREIAAGIDARIGPRVAATPDGPATARPDGPPMARDASMAREWPTAAPEINEHPAKIAENGA